MAKVKFYYKTAKPTGGMAEGSLYFVSDGTNIRLYRATGATTSEEVGGDKLSAKPDGSNPLIVGNKIQEMYLPSSVVGGLQYKGTFNASTGSTITGLTKGWYYICATAGSKNPDATTASAAYTVGDWAIYNGTSWDKLDASNDVQSVAGLTGVITAAALGQKFTQAAPVAYATSAGTASTANAFSSKNIGSATKGVYINASGVPTACTYSVAKDVPSDAVFTDTKYSASTGLSLSGTAFSLKKATTTEIGGVVAAKVLTTTQTTSETTTANRYYGVQVDSNGKAFVNVPWTDNSGNYIPLSGSSAITGDLISNNYSSLGSASNPWDHIYGDTIHVDDYIDVYNDIRINGSSISSLFAAASHTHLYAGSSSEGGAANSAVKLSTARTLTIGGTGKSFDGSANVAWTLAEIGAAAASDLEWLS